MANTVISTGGVIGSPSFAQANKFLLSFTRLPTMTFMCQKVNVPAVNVQPAVQATPGSNSPLTGNKFHYAPLIVTFLLDEDLLAWTTIFDWLSGIGFPEASDQYKNYSMQQRLLLRSGFPQYSDATLTYFNNQNAPIVSYDFNYAFPTVLGDIQFDVQQPATTVMTVTAEFHYQSYEYKRYT
jgi:hypothetical protein